MLDDEILIAGAGLGGLTAAIALASLGFPVRVFEQAPELGEIGAGITLYPNSLRVLHHLGLETGLDELAMEPSDAGLFHYQTGERLSGATRARTRSNRDELPEYRIHRADLHGLLRDRFEDLAPGGIHPGKMVVSCRQTASGVEVSFADGSTASGAALIGADGIRSRVREAFFGDSKPNYTGYVAWRALVPTAGLPELAVEPMSAVWVGPGHQFVRYQVRRGEILNYVAFGNQPGWEVESWTERVELDELLGRFEGWHPAVRAIIEATPRDQCYKYALFDRDPLPYWSRGAITLLGDAAHPTLPFIGQGAGMAIEDGMIVARCLATFGSPEEAFQCYEGLRRERTALVQLLSRQAAAGRLNDPAPAVITGPNEAEQERIRLQREIARYDAVTVPLV